MLINLKEIPFSRYGSYFAFSHFINSSKGISDKDLYLRTVHGGEAMLPLMKVELLRQGTSAEFKETAVPHLLCLEAENAFAEICIAEPSVIRIRGRHAGIRLCINTPQFKSIYPYKGHYELNAYSHRLMFTPIKGSLRIEAPWNSMESEYIIIDICPDESGQMECAIEEYLSVWAPRTYNNSFDSCVNTVARSFHDWLDKTLCVPREYEEARQLAAYINWSSVVEPSGHIKRDTMLMSKNWMTNVWSWDYCFNAMALVKTNPSQAWEQFMYLVDYQDKDGVIPDCLNDSFKIFSFVKPPIQGWALNWMLERTDAITDDHLRQIYPALTKWTDFWMNFRDSDNDGLPEYYHGNDSGWDNSTIFRDCIPVASPDLASFLVIQMETLAKVAKRLGLTDEAESWNTRAAKLLDTELALLWTGSRFVAIHAGDHKIIHSDSLITYLTVLLGRRLPHKILSVLIRDLKNTELFLTEFGLATELPGSPYYEADGYWRGPIWAPSTLLIVDGLISAGEKELAREISAKFCLMIKSAGMAENFNALTGEGLRDRAYTWTSSVFLILANEYL